MAIAIAISIRFMNILYILILILIDRQSSPKRMKYLRSSISATLSRLVIQSTVMSRAGMRFWTQLSVWKALMRTFLPATILMTVAKVAKFETTLSHKYIRKIKTPYPLIDELRVILLGRLFLKISMTLVDDVFEIADLRCLILCGPPCIIYKYLETYEIK